mmetsp:Transcript_47263/g.88552  ORF Transcript_47263/g.88552 Transcript_47263/m.88552 type:complete len:322 (+) Transcript_47263:35-1000(+)
MGASSASCSALGEPGSPEAAARRAVGFSADTPLKVRRRRLPGADNEELIELPPGALMALAHIQDARERAQHQWQSSEVLESSQRRADSAACMICLGSPARPDRPEAFSDFPIFEDHHRMQADDKGDLLLPSRDSTLEYVRSPVREEIALTAGTPAAEGTPQAACKTSHTLVYSTPERGREVWMPASIMHDRCPAPPPTPQGVRVYSTPPPARCKADRTPCSVPAEGKACDVLLPLASNSALENAGIHELGQPDSALHAWRGLVNLSGKRLEMKTESGKMVSPSYQRCPDADPVEQENMPCVLASNGISDFGMASKMHARGE